MIVDSIAALEAIYAPSLAPASVAKVTAAITPDYAALIAAAPFAVLATSGPEGLDCSPRGDRPGFVRVAGPRTLILPDRRGNNRIDSLRNVVRDPRVALLFLIPGSGTTFRVNGTAVISADPDLLDSFRVDGHAPRTALVITVEAAYFQCARAIIRARLWEPDARVDPADLPSPGAILAALTAGEVGGQVYDAEWPGRAAKTMW
ncbi:MULTISPECIES: pyridoxamine 5'-phosphate oxidase family protein [unclassified Methylobacterium]|uniref:pyridoxamine 5'-phosphate oxidase family protein n=1 Tax=unclassified Methylobacterium TaxID=2615210 RepID=UPI0011C1EEF7|nr:MULTISPECIES: pyridoxamine 5'-phosphate oxidase family protein [unclassified Methylobacterium]QEE42679.1 pyridoxamine 5'-phosphate oxidase family protein [Methylobacterium sp. WL1]TXN02287.1 pyridoxamine 5'-phosphate oxidase family protein [Methylobacterium sp. WL64]TXN57199.1 pyridoxamine 5'-phosphate oxidase family protein [Methylobacterium sp. WL2]